MKEAAPVRIVRLLFIPLLVYLSFGAASSGTREIVWKRDQGKCRDCGKRSKDKYYLECSHNDHTRNEYYDMPSNLKLLCLFCHKFAHIRRAGRNGLTLEQNQRAIQLIEERIENIRREGRLKV